MAWHLGGYETLMRQRLCCLIICLANYNIFSLADHTLSSGAAIVKCINCFFPKCQLSPCFLN